jgi:hypothetical protein
MTEGVQLWTVATVPGVDNLTFALPASSSDGGATWEKQQVLAALGSWGYVLHPVRDALWLLGVGGTYAEEGARAPFPGPDVATMDTDGAWTSVAWELPLDGQTSVFLSASEFSGSLWVGTLLNFAPTTFGPQFLVLNQILPGTTFTLAPATLGAAE